MHHFTKVVEKRGLNNINHEELVKAITPKVLHTLHTVKTLHTLHRGGS